VGEPATAQPPGAVEAAPPPAPPAAHARRVIFIDLARALAVVFMLYGHTVSALLAPDYQRGTWYDVWQFQRGMTSGLFLLLSGFAFSIATGRHWASHLALSPALLRRARRFGLFVLLGYALHFPVARFVMLDEATDAQWRAFLAVDVLQLIGATFVLVQGLVLLARSRRVFTVAALTLALAVVAVTPTIYRVDWGRLLPAWLAAYMSPATGSLFPVFPWAGFVLAGAGLGQIYSRWGAARLTTFARAALFLPGLLLVAAGAAARRWPQTALSLDTLGFIPGEFAMRAGACLILLAAIAYLSRGITHLPRVFGAVAQETLLIYFVHLCLVYGSVWNPGLAQFVGGRLEPGTTVVTVVLLITAMAGLAWYWHWWKHLRPRAARWTSITAGALLVVWLV
jgi:uncharacterized membrane protein